MRGTYINKTIANKIAELEAKGYDKIPYKYYHYRTFDAGTLATKYNFFHQVIGDTDGNYTLTEEDTNMDRKSEFSYPFLAQYLSAMVIPAHDENQFIEEIDTTAQGYAFGKTLINDILKIYHRGVVKLSVQNKELLKVTPLIHIPSAIGVNGSVALSSSKSDSSKIYVGGVLVNGIDKKMPVEILFGDGIKFDFSLEYQKSAPTIANKLRIGFILEGILFRK